MDPVAQRLLKAINREVSKQAAELRNELLEDTCLANFFSSKDAQEEGSNGEGEKKDAQEEEEGSKGDEEEVASPSSAAVAEELMGE